MTAQTKLIDLPVEPLDAAAFAPYGTVIEGLPASGRWQEGKFHLVSLGFGVEGTADLRLARYPYQAMEFSRLERHFTMTESRVPLGKPVVLIVAGDTPPDDRHALPDPASLRALLMRGDQGVMFKRRAWHGLDCFPLAPPHADFAFFTESESEDEFGDGYSAEGLQRSQIVGYAETRSLSFHVTDPAGLLAQAPTI